MIKKKVLVITAFILVIALAVGAVLVAVMSPNKEPDGNKETDDAHDEMFVRELLDNSKITDIVNDSEWEAAIIDSTENYVVVSSEKFDFSKKIGIENGYTNIYFDTETQDINMLQHNFVSYTNDLDPKEELQNLIGNVQSDINAALGNPSEPFMLINTSGEADDYDGLSIDEMIDKVLEGGNVIYVMYESDGLRYEMNIMFSDNTIYSMVWIYDDSELHGDSQ